MQELTKELLITILAEAREEAKKVAQDFYDNQCGGRDQYPCGFAWLNIYKYNGVKLKGNTKVGRLLKSVGVEQDYARVFQIWNPSGLPVQNVDIKEAGARAAADVFTKYGFEAFAGQRWD
jgi:hypothetical protein